MSIRIGIILKFNSYSLENGQMERPIYFVLKTFTVNININYDSNRK